MLEGASLANTLVHSYVEGNICIFHIELQSDMMVEASQEKAFYLSVSTHCYATPVQLNSLTHGTSNSGCGHKQHQNMQWFEMTKKKLLPAFSLNI